MANTSNAPLRSIQESLSSLWTVIVPRSPDMDLRLSGRRQRRNNFLRNLPIRAISMNTTRELKSREIDVMEFIWSDDETKSA